MYPVGIPLLGGVTRAQYCTLEKGAGTRSEGGVVWPVPGKRRLNGPEATRRPIPPARGGQGLGCHDPQADARGYPLTRRRCFLWEAMLEALRRLTCGRVAAA